MPAKPEEKMLLWLCLKYKEVSLLKFVFQIFTDEAWHGDNNAFCKVCWCGINKLQKLRERKKRQIFKGLMPFALCSSSTEYFVSTLWPPCGAFVFSVRSIFCHHCCYRTVRVESHLQEAACLLNPPPGFFFPPCQTLAAMLRSWFSFSDKCWNSYLATAVFSSCPHW